MLSLLGEPKACNVDTYHECALPNLGKWNLRWIYYRGIFKKGRVGRYVWGTLYCMEETRIWHKTSVSCYKTRVSSYQIRVSCYKTRVSCFPTLISLKKMRVLSYKNASLTRNYSGKNTSLVLQTPDSGVRTTTLTQNTRALRFQNCKTRVNICNTIGSLVLEILHFKNWLRHVIKKYVTASIKQVPRQSSQTNLVNKPDWE